MYILNAFSIQMVEAPCVAICQEVENLPEGLESAIGHADTAHVLGYEPNRINVKLKEGDTAYVAQLMGGRLPEGTTTLPEGFTFKFFRVDIVNINALWQCYANGYSDGTEDGATNQWYLPNKEEILNDVLTGKYRRES